MSLEKDTDINIRGNLALLDNFARTVQSIFSVTRERLRNIYTPVCKEDDDSHSDSIESRERGRPAGSTLPRAAASEQASERANIASGTELRLKLWLRLGRYNIIISRLCVVFITLLNIHRAIISY